MDDVVVGLLGLLVGAAFCFRGWILLRILLAVWGAFAGFFLGAGAVAAATGDSFLGDVLAWVVGALVAVVFAVLAYAFYAVSVLLALASSGYLLGATLMVGLGIDWTWLIVLVGVLAGALLAFVAMIGRAPLMLLVLVSATAGASALVGGIMFLAGTVEVADLDGTTVVDRIDASPWWWLLWLVVAAAGVVVQVRTTARTTVDVRREWHGETSTRRR